MSNNENDPQSTGDGAPRAATSPWIRPAERPRVGRIGDWDNSSASSSSRRGGIGTLGSIGGGSSSGPSRRPQHDSDEDEDDEDERKAAETWFAGGERSGINVQNPESRSGRSLAEDLVKKAKRTSEARGAAAADAGPQYFTGGGYRLGDDETESSYIPDENDQSNIVTRHATLWNNGWQIDGGELRPYEGNEAVLESILRGRAPPGVFDIEDGQQVDMIIDKKTGQDYVPPAGPRAFVGTGNRLGAPVPSEGSSTMPGDFPSASSATPQSEPAGVTTRFEVDQTLPTTSVQIRLADGTRMVSRINLTHTVADIRNFINASRPENRTRPYTISTTFPNRVLEDTTQTIEAAKLQNSVVLQRWA